MPVTLPDSFLQEKNAQINEPIYLYRVQISNNPGASGEPEDLFLAEYHEDVPYFREDSGEFTPQVYTRFPLTHSDITTNNEAMVDSLNVSVANVNREMQYYIEQYDGLSGRKVTIFLVFKSLLSESSAHIAHVFYVDGGTADENRITLNLTSKMDLLDVTLPRRLYMRSFCQWKLYKNTGGCWRASGEAPAGFVADITTTLTGSIDPTASVNVIGVGTKFLTELLVGDRIVVTGETRYVVSITDNTHLTVSVAFSDNANDTSPDRLRDACSKTFAACLLHNNTLRFGGFPSVPSNKTITF